MNNFFKNMRLWTLCLGLAMSATSAIAMPQGQDTFVQDELLIVPAPNGLLNVGAMGYKVMNKQDGKTPFLRVKLKKGETVLLAMNALAGNSNIAYVQPNYIYRAALVPNDPRFNEYWALKNTGQAVNGGAAGTSGADMAVEKAWGVNTDCSTITVAVIDTGVDYNHPDLATNIWSNAGEIANNGIDDDGNGFIDDIRGWDFVQADNDPMDFAHHGTHVAGTIGASGNNGTGGTGVCWTSTIMPLRVLGSTGSGTTADIIAAIDYATANGAKVINMSLGGPGGSTGDLTDQAIARANAAGVLVVIAAGNDGTDNDTTPSYPAAYTQPNIIAVAATTQSDALASFSNFGATSVDIGAPGTSILSTVPPARSAIPGCSWNFDTATLQGWTVSTWDTTGVPVLTTNTVAISTEAAKSPFYSLTDTPGTVYANNRSYRAVSPTCNLTGVQGALLKYNLELASESNFDYLYVETSPDGVTWTPGSPLSGTTSGVFYPLELDMKSLDGAPSAQVRFRFDTDFSVVFGGYHADDIQMTKPNTSVAAHSAADYAFLDGTSMATPNVAGVAALVWAADAGLTVAQLKSRILNNADVNPALAGKTVTGKRVNAMMAMPLQAATGLTATVQTASSVSLSWVDNSISESNYRVQRDAGVGFATIATLATNSAAYTDSAAPSNTTLTYRVVALARDGRIINSATASATTPVATAPAATPAASSGGGGGCVMGGQQNGIDPLFPILLALALGALYRRRRNV